MKNEIRLAFGRADTEIDGFDCTSQTIVTDCNIGDVVWATNSVNGLIDSTGGNTIFTGVLVHLYNDND